MTGHARLGLRGRSADDTGDDGATFGSMAVTPAAPGAGEGVQRRAEIDMRSGLSSDNGSGCLRTACGPTVHIGKFKREGGGMVSGWVGPRRGLGVGLFAGL